MNYFQKKYLFKIEINSDQQLIIPEYRIELLNKSKKIIDKFENFNNIIEFKKSNPKKKVEKKELKKTKREIKKSKAKKSLRTLWVRRKKRIK